MTLFSKHNFSVISFAPGRVAGCSFRCRRSGWKLERFASEAVTDGDGGAWRAVMRGIGCRKGTPLVVTGALENGIFFCADSVELPERERRGALEFELPRYLPQPPQSPRVQFYTFPASENGVVNVNVYAFDATALDRFSELMSLANCRPDEFCHPLIGVGAADPAVELPEIEPGFYFPRGQWQSTAGAGQILQRAQEEWREVLSRVFELPHHDDFHLGEHLSELLTARMLATCDFHARRVGLRVIPDRLRPVRFRRQLTISAVLLVLIGAVQLLGGTGEWRRNLQEYRAAVAERDRIKRETSQIRDQLRRRAKELKEETRVVSANPGEYQVVEALAEISEAIPSSVLAVSARWSDTGVELVLLGTADGPDPAEYLRTLKNWKIDQLQQRQGGGSAVVSSTVKLVRISQEKTKNKRGGK